MIKIVEAYLSGYAFAFKGDLMKKLLCILIAVLMVFLCACQQKPEPAETTSTTVTETTTEEPTNVYDNFETETNYWVDNPDDVATTIQAETTTKAASQGQKTSEETTKSNVVTYYSESPDNKYIKYISNKYSVDPALLRALIRTNTEVRGATVLQFSGDRDSSGKLLMTEDTLRAVYDIDGNGKVMKATGKTTGYEGYSYWANIAAFKVAQQYVIPNIAATKAQHTYEDYYKN